jgi:hypothetical protein
MGYRIQRDARQPYSGSRVTMQEVDAHIAITDLSTSSTA